jgi:hypothetical protein
LLRLDGLVLHVRPQARYHLTRNEHDLSVLATLWALDGKLSVVYIFRGELQDFAYPHPSTGRQFQDEPIPDLCCSEDDLIDRLLFDSVPMDRFAEPVESLQHRGITGVLNGGIEIGLDEIEEGLEVGIASVLGLLLSALSDLVQKRENLLGCDSGKIVVFAEVVGLTRGFLFIPQPGELSFLSDSSS